MKTRIIKTKIWTDSKIMSLSPNARLLIVFLLTSPQVGMTNYIECPDALITLFTGIKSLDNIKEELSSKNIAHFHDGWVFIPNLEKHNNYKNSPSNIAAYNNEISSIPKDILQYWDTSVDTTVYSNHKPKTINHKSKSSSKKSKLDSDKNKSHTKILDTWNATMESKFKTLPEKNIEYWLTKYSLQEVLEAIENIPYHEWLSDKAKPDMFFRQSDGKGNSVDRIGECLSVRRTNRMFDKSKQL